jgi:2-dehydro-3-deoxyphosphooctonate aldolase (KDO 8-P synthase)
MCARELGVPVLTDVTRGRPDPAEVAAVVDVLQTPAFLCRQTDFIRAVASSGKPVNIKKGQFLAPGDMKKVIDEGARGRPAGRRRRCRRADCIMACERGASFGYNNLVSDMRSLAIMRETGCPVVFDATHSVQLPGGQGNRVGRPARVRAGAGARGVAVGVAGLFMETHPGSRQGQVRRSQRLCPWHMPELLATLIELDRGQEERLLKSN